MFQRNSSFGYLVNLLARLFIRALDRRIETHGLAHGQFPALLMVWERPGLTQAEIAAAVSVEQPTMANTLNRMERDGLIERRPDPLDRRRSLVYPAERALAIRDEVLGCAMEVNARATGGMSDADKAEAIRLMRIMTANLQAGSD
jgi:DNA-binding MarR family transcriptional regulator